MAMPLHENPAERWKEIEDFYVEFTVTPHWEFLAPMIDFVKHLAAHPRRSELWPTTSHEWLCISAVAGYHPDTPGFSFRPDGAEGYRFQYYGRTGRLSFARSCPATEALDFLDRLVDRLGEDQAAYDLRKSIKPPPNEGKA